MSTQELDRPPLPPPPAVPIPGRLAHRPRNRGYIVPWFVAWVDGKPDFRVVDARKIPVAVRGRKCWLCGDSLGGDFSFVIGPMCAINRVSSEPPSHRECAEYAVRVCPFLTRPGMHRRDNNLPDGSVEAPGMAIMRNPGVILVWDTRDYRPFEAPQSGGGRSVLFKIGDPLGTRWYTEGRTASRAEVLDSINSGVPLLRDAAAQDGPEAERSLDQMHAAALAYLPVEVAP